MQRSATRATVASGAARPDRVHLYRAVNSARKKVAVSVTFALVFTLAQAATRRKCRQAGRTVVLVTTSVRSERMCRERPIY